jgi:hypothetical protein
MGSIIPFNHEWKSKLAQMVTFLTCIRDAAGSNIGQNIGSSNCFSGIYSVPPRKYEDSTGKVN